MIDALEDEVGLDTALPTNKRSSLSHWNRANCNCALCWLPRCNTKYWSKRRAMSSLRHAPSKALRRVVSGVTCVSRKCRLMHPLQASKKRSSEGWSGLRSSSEERSKPRWQLRWQRARPIAWEGRPRTMCLTYSTENCRIGLTSNVSGSKRC